MSEEADHHLPSLISPANESSECQTSHSCIRGTQTSVSARKLANALWGMNKIPSPTTLVALHEKILKKERMMSSRRHSTTDPPHTSGSKIPRRSSSRRMKCQIYDDKSRRARRKDVAPPHLQTNSEGGEGGGARPGLMINKDTAAGPK
uniref:Uncharacterized protein n=1 Tax=Ananas comosus var. bracteatus TaxID=296719 RepID=A0A6V7PSQ4_ANACO|nr:unnamed protein product [Ananas comosus var. bracteatus]